MTPMDMGYFMGYSALPTSSPELRALNAYEARRLAALVGGYSAGDDSSGVAGGSANPTKYNCSLLDCTHLLLDYSAAGSHADLVAQPTAKLFKMSAFGWDDRDAVGFIRSGWSAEASGLKGALKCNALS